MDSLLVRCPWYIAGPAIGLILVLFRAALNKPFGAMGGFIALVERKNTSTGTGRLNMSAFVLIGTVAGGTVFALASGGFHPTTAYASGGVIPADPVLAFVVLLSAGIVMGWGARLAGGCTSGHGLCGMSLGSPASVGATMTFFATAVLLANTFAWFGGRL